MARAMCMATRFILASDHWPDKLNHDATRFLEKVVERLGRLPLLLLSDKLRGYKTGYKNAMGTGPKTCHHARTRCGRQQVPRKQQPARAPQRADTERRKKGSRVFNSDDPGLFVLDEIHHNFPPATHGAGRADPRREGGHHNTGARQAAHSDSVFCRVPLQFCLVGWCGAHQDSMFPLGHAPGALPRRHL